MGGEQYILSAVMHADEINRAMTEALGREVYHYHLHVVYVSVVEKQKRPRAWVYARIPGDYDGTMNSYKVCSMQALHDGCDIVGGSIDERGGWLLRPGYRDMMQQIKGGKVDRVYICRMRQISGKERHLYSFFKRLMQRGIQVTATEYSLRDRVNMFRLARRVERYATRKGLQLPW